jgi:hypothetical protein
MTNSTATNGVHASRSGTVVITAKSLAATMVQREIANQISPSYVEDGKTAARAIYDVCTAVHPGPLDRDRNGDAQLARSARNGTVYWNAPGQMLRGFARSALMSAYFENESAARAWTAFEIAQDKAREDHSGDVQAVDGTTATGAAATEGGGNDLDRAAARAMDAVASAAHWVTFAVELATLVSNLGDGEPIQSSYTPRATDEGKAVVPKAAATLAQFMAKARAAG